MVSALPPISFGSRGFITKTGDVFGWSILDGTHADYHSRHGTSDAVFQSRWRKWSERAPIDIDYEPDPRMYADVERWLAAHANDIIPMPNVS